MFFKGSRYENVPELQTEMDGRVVTFKATRWISPTRVRASHVVSDHERLDHIAGRELQDPELFWRICDANGAMWPPELTAEPGRRILIPPTEA